MARLTFTAAERARVTEAVAAAERDTNGEIVTIVTGRSDAYHDVALHYAVAAMLLLAGVAAVWPWILEAKLDWLHGGWTSAVDLRELLLLVLVGQALVFLIIRFVLAWNPLRMLVTPGATKGRRVRRRALQYFRSSAEKRTMGRVGILLYLSLAERRAEIVADEAIHGLVPQERWGDAMAALVAKVRTGDAAGGMADAVGEIATILAEHFPKTEADMNELPDRLIEL
ncbi:MAG: TPM domain-containing protein [Pseudomonadota bacterium]